MQKKKQKYVYIEKEKKMNTYAAAVVHGLIMAALVLLTIIVILAVISISFGMVLVFFPKMSAYHKRPELCHKVDHPAIDKYNDFCKKYPNIAQKVINGIGPDGYEDLIPNTFFFNFNVTNATEVHDFLYGHFGPKSISRKDADQLFLNTLLQDLNRQSMASQVLNLLPVYFLYGTVRMAGHSAYQSKKIQWN